MFLCPLGSALLRPVTVGGSPWFEGAMIPLAAPGSPGQCLGLNPALCECGAIQAMPCVCPTGTGWLPVFGNGHDNTEDSWAFKGREISVMCLRPGCSFYPIFNVGVTSVGLGAQLRV